MKKREILFERWNAISHLAGVILGLFFLISLLIPAIEQWDAAKIVGFSIYGLCFIVLFLASFLYHNSRNPKVKKRLRVFDHISIYFFIAGTYTPILLVLLNGWLRILTMIIIWTCAIVGTFYKIFTYKNYDKYKGLSTILYIVMGWISVFLIKPILDQTSYKFMLWILIGGILYTVGTYFYKSKRFYYNHVIWHFFVLFAAIFQFTGIYQYLA